MSLVANGFLAIGLGGVLVGAHDPEQARHYGEIVASQDLRRIKWTGRIAYITFDANLATNPLVALGLAYAWVALQGLGADVRAVRIPLWHPQDVDIEAGQFFQEQDQGPDDFLARSGVEAFRQLVADSIPADPAKRVAQAAEGLTGPARVDAVLRILQDLSAQACLHVGGEVLREGVAGQLRKFGMGKKVLNEVIANFKERLSRSLPKPEDDRRCTDLGNAERMVSLFGQDLLYVPKWKEWYVWDGAHWTPDATLRVETCAKETARAIQDEAEQANNDDLRTWGLASESRSKQLAMVDLARSDPRVCTVPEAFNADGSAYWLNCPNGTVDLRTGELRPNNRDDRLTTVTGVPFEPYDPAKAPKWEGFLGQVQPDQEKRSFLQRATGASLIGETLDHHVLIHQGGGQNGKGTFFERLLHALGDYGRAIPEELLVANSGQHPTVYATLFGCRLAIVAETKHGDALACSRLKKLTGGDTIAARRMGEDWWNYRPVAHLHVHTNAIPRVTDDTLGMWRRLLLVEWSVTIPEDQLNTRLPKELEEEGAQILGWCVAGAIEYLRDGLRVPSSVREVTAEWRANEDPLGQFLDECCNTQQNGHELRVLKNDLYKAYADWCEEGGLKPKGKITFGKDMQAKLPAMKEAREPGTGRRLWTGIELREGHLFHPREPEFVDVLGNV
jgi:putative DNA primase/helicase